MNATSICFECTSGHSVSLNPHSAISDSHSVGKTVSFALGDHDLFFSCSALKSLFRKKKDRFYGNWNWSIPLKEWWSLLIHNFYCFFSAPQRESAHSCHIIPSFCFYFLTPVVGSLIAGFVASELLARAFWHIDPKSKDKKKPQSIEFLARERAESIDEFWCLLPFFFLVCSFSRFESIQRWCSFFIFRNLLPIFCLKRTYQFDSCA